MVKLSAEHSFQAFSDPVACNTEYSCYALLYHRPNAVSTVQWMEGLLLYFFLTLGAFPSPIRSIPQPKSVAWKPQELRAAGFM